MKLRTASTGISRKVSHARTIAWLALGTLATALVLPACTYAQQATRPCGDECELIRQLLKRMEEMEARIKQLEAERLQPGTGAPATAIAPETPSVKPAPEAPETNQNPSAADMNADVPASGPNLRIRGFMDMNLHGSNLKGDTTSFSLGQFDLFVASRISDTVSVLADIVFEPEPDNSAAVDLERVILQYAPKDIFHLGIAATIRPSVITTRPSITGLGSRPPRDAP